MWIFLNKAFLSVVAHRNKLDMLLVRARVAGDLERVFAGAVVTMTPSADHRFRAVIPREEAARVLAKQVAAIDYPNFKDSVWEPDRHHAYFASWRAMRAFQLQGGST